MERKNAFELSFSSRSKYRDRKTILADILKAVSDGKKGKKKTQIMQSANLSYAQTKKYLSYLLRRGFISFTEERTYVITDKGSMFLQLTEMQKIHNIS